LGESDYESEEADVDTLEYESEVEVDREEPNIEMRTDSQVELFVIDEDTTHFTAVEENQYTANTTHTASF